MNEELNNCRCGGKPEVAGMTTPFASQATAVCRDCGTVVIVRSARKTSDELQRLAKAAWNAVCEEETK